VAVGQLSNSPDSSNRGAGLVTHTVRQHLLRQPAIAEIYTQSWPMWHCSYRRSMSSWNWSSDKI